LAHPIIVRCDLPRFAQSIEIVAQLSLNACMESGLVTLKSVRCHRIRDPSVCYPEPFVLLTPHR
jgi:hypothetical protein